MSNHTDRDCKPIDLPAVLEAHALWRRTDGAEGTRADLAGADLAGANLACASGCVLLTETDHGFRVVAMMRDGEWRIYAGCRDFTIAEARAHWGADDYHTPLSGRRVVACLDWLERERAAGFTLGAK